MLKEFEEIKRKEANQRMWQQLLMMKGGDDEEDE